LVLAFVLSKKIKLVVTVLMMKIYFI